MEHEEERGGGREEEAKDKRRTDPGTERYVLISSAPACDFD